MKRMITMSALLAIIVALGVAESVISSSLYRRLSVTIGEIESIVKENGDDFSDGKAIEKTNEAIEEWEKWRSFARMTSNHTTVRGFEDRLYSMRAYVECGSYEDSVAYAAIARELADDLSVETYVLLPNLL